MLAPIRWDRSGSDLLNERDRALIAAVPDSLDGGIRLMSWWHETDAARNYGERFELVRTFNDADSGFGFFGRAPLPGRDLPVMGLFQEMFFDRPKGAEALFIRDQIREFVLRYFLRVSDFRRPSAYAPSDPASRVGGLPGLDWCPTGEERYGGFGYSQLYYKLAGSGLVGKFPPEERAAIVDLREIGPRYEWVVAKVRIFNFNLDFQPLGPGWPYLALPLQEESLLVISREFIRHLDRPEPGLLGKYGFGYALLRDPEARGVVAYGPGHFDAGFQLFDFKVLDSGEVRVCLTFTANRPERILNLPLNPVDWGLRMADVMSLGLASRVFGPVLGAAGSAGGDPVFTWIAMANTLTGGRAARDLCISRERLEKDMLLQHFLEHYTLISGALVTWRRVRDWCDAAALPDWVLAGRSR